MSWIQSSFGSKTSPVILFTIVVLAFVFFIAALLHLLIRFLLKQRSSNNINYPEIPTSTVFQRQLQHLFHLHDSGLDQATIDALPVFLYKDIMGFSNEPFDCAVCLCEFLKEDKLRLLPLCSHAFHIDCIDTWLLSNSTCPLCRGVILSSGFSFENPVYYFGDSKENEDGYCSGNGKIVGVHSDSSAVISDKRVFSVRLGKFKSINNSENVEIEVGETSSNCNLDARRCYSMGSFQYVVDNSDLQVALCSSSRDVRNVKGGGGQIGNFTCEGGDTSSNDNNGKKINSGAKGESFSVSKIWLWSKKGTNYSNSVNVSLP
ncbi:hypothetical protein ACJIZ3_010284 [Penstemon smallii]|uniref:RING-type E3 ubiquitin transferase n=1 Tax=Penstemon smallii TaxID=265156 RepID=A0ABD3THA9_9LAMI